MEAAPVSQYTLNIPGDGDTIEDGERSGGELTIPTMNQYKTAVLSFRIKQIASMNTCITVANNIDEIKSASFALFQACLMACARKFVKIKSATSHFVEKCSYQYFTLQLNIHNNRTIKFMQLKV